MVTFCSLKCCRRFYSVTVVPELTTTRVGELGFLLGAKQRAQVEANLHSEERVAAFPCDSAPLLDPR
ncbi:MAG: hypothetical protein RL199_658 [Pseudomonadota bacterium]